MMVCFRFNLVLAKNYVFNYTNYIDERIIELMYMKLNNVMSTKDEKCLSKNHRGMGNLFTG